VAAVFSLPASPIEVGEEMGSGDELVAGLDTVDALLEVAGLEVVV